jgi:hypothetical protein
MRIFFANSETAAICQNEGTTLTLDNGGLPEGHPFFCQYSSFYDVVVDGNPVTVKIFYLTNGPGCAFQVVGYSGSGSIGVMAVSIDGGPCA